MTILPLSTKALCFANCPPPLVAYIFYVQVSPVDHLLCVWAVHVDASTNKLIPLASFVPMYDALGFDNGS